MKDLLKLNRYFKKYKGTLTLGVVFLCVANLFLVWIPILIRQTMDEVEELVDERAELYESTLEALLSPVAGSVLATNMMFLLGAVVLYGLLLFATRQTIIVTSRKIEYDLRNEIFDHLLKLPQRFYSTRNSGDIYTRTTEDVVRVREYFGPAFMYMVNTLSRAGIIITIMLLVNAQLTFWALLPLPLLTVLAYWVSGFINRRSHEIQHQYARIADRAQEAYSSARLIKAFNREEYEQQRFERESEEYRKKKLRLDIIESLFHPMLNLLIGLSVVLVIWQGGMMVINGLVTVGNIAEFVIYVTFLTWPVASLGYTLNLLQRSAASNKRIMELFSISHEIQDDEQTRSDISELKGEVTFRNVRFRYPGSEAYALRNINLHIRAGETVGVLGRTGSGKTTLVNLLPRLYDATEGQIYIDGIPIREIPVDVLRRLIGFVPQDNFLFSDTIGNNIAFGRDDADEQQIREAASKAEILDNILDFDQKFDTMIGERGVTLSGGQKQRTSIARALIRKPGILIMDDSLSAVDTNTENAIVNHLKDESKDITSIIISHRVSSIQNADRIFVLDDGELKEEGAHNELLKREGLYASMYRKQLIEEELEEL